MVTKIKRKKIPNHLSANVSLFVIAILSVMTFLMLIFVFTTKYYIDSNDFSITERNQTLKSLTQRLLFEIDDFNKDAENSNKLSALRQTIDERNSAIIKALPNNSADVAKILIIPSVSKNFPQFVQDSIEQEVTIQGDYQFFHADNFDGENLDYSHQITTENKTYDLYFEGRRDKELAQVESKIKVTGLAFGNKIFITDLHNIKKITSKEPKIAGVSTKTTKRVAVVLFNFLNNSTNLITADSARSTTFTGTKSVNAYYQEASYTAWDLQGKLRADGDVFGPYTINYSEDGITCPYTTWSAAAQTAAAVDGFVRTNYNSVVYAWSDLNGTCQKVVGGRAWTSGTSTYIVSGYNTATIAHELGHAFGLVHAHAYSCTSGGIKVPISTTCTVADYGDYVMMGATTSYHFNNIYKNKLGFFSASNISTITASGTYTIEPIETNTAGVQALKIARSAVSGDYYWLEFRQPYGFDNFSTSSPYVNGINIRVEHFTQSYLLDVTTPNLTSFTDAPLAVGQVFTDVASGVSVKTVSISSTSATVQVTLGIAPCVRANPAITISPSAQWGTPGQALSYSTTVTNNDTTSCGSSGFTIASTLPTGFTQTPASPLLNLAPGTSGTQIIQVTSPSTSTEGIYSYTVKATNSYATTYTTSANASYNIAASTDTTVPSASISSPISGAVVNGTTTVAVTATDDIAVTKVELYNNGILISSDTTAPYSFAWDTTATANGSKILIAKAYDAAGNIGTSAGVSVTVSNTTPRAQIQLSPTTFNFDGISGQSAPAVQDLTITNTGSATLNWTTATNFTWCHVSPAAGAVTVGTNISAAVSLDDPSSIGTFTCTITISDSVASNSPQTATAIYSVAASDTTPPATMLTNPGSGTIVSGTITLTATATDNVAVAGISFKVDGVQVGVEDTAGPTYSVTWDTKLSSNGTHTLTAVGRDTNGNLGTSASINVTVSNITLVGDLNGDRIVNAIDWSLMNLKWLTNDATTDLNSDGIVNSLDYSLLNANWFKTI